MNIEKEREALVAEIELFIAEAMKAYVVERWADSYQRTEPFAYTIDDKNEVWWMKTQAHQLWQFWKAAKAHESEKLEGCVVVPVEPTQEMLDKGYRAINHGMSNIMNSERIYKAMIEAARGGNE
ncbi:hypothetical protein ACG9XS_08600 [Acinetobacter gyllenbergii]|uniref:hypothetical protein n=1 Tax=Acinetobacter gyllenbergii TaxID=134534 RepID=UPI003AF40FEA